MNYAKREVAEQETAERVRAAWAESAQRQGKRLPFRHLLFMVTLLAVPLAVSAQSVDSNLGRNLAATCANCHSITGKAIKGIPIIPDQPKESLANLLKEFKRGIRPGTVMNQLAKGYTDLQLDAVAEYYAAKK